MSKPAQVEAETRVDRKRSGPADEKNGRKGPGPQCLTALTVVGVVYGDLGTSAIYALNAVFSGGPRPLEPSDANVLGVLSLVFWTLIVTVCLKYMTFVLRADNHGEGGTFALLALLRPWRRLDRPLRHALVVLGLAGAAMLYAGIMITPAISILSAVEGLGVASPAMAEYVVPVTLVILVALFAVQHMGTARIGIVFGPIMVLWFVVIAGLGLHGILLAPRILGAIDPRHAVQFFAENGIFGFVLLFGVFLVTTGAEALYADIGHFGRTPIRLIWFLFVLPALLLNYFGQGGMLLANPAATAHPFYHLIPPILLYPVVVLATLATIIASQAVITGAFSMTRQAARLGMMPRARLVQTSAETSGQIYIPAVNWLLMLAAIVLVVLFQSSERLASTYGISVGSTMVVTTILAFFVARERGRWPLWAALLFLVGFLTVDLAYFGANMLRILDGGWFPVMVGAMFFAVMSTWRRGGELLARQADDQTMEIDELEQRLAGESVARVPGTAIFLTPWVRNVPPSLIHHVERNHALQKQVILLTVLTEDVPRTTSEERIEIDDLGEGFHRVILRYGYMQGVNVPSELAACGGIGLDVDLDKATYYIAHQHPISGRGRRDGMARWRDRLLGFLMRNSADATARFQIPTAKTMDVGRRVRI